MCPLLYKASASARDTKSVHQGCVCVESLLIIKGHVVCLCMIGYSKFMFIDMKCVNKKVIMLLIWMKNGRCQNTPKIKQNSPVLFISSQIRSTCISFMGFSSIELSFLALIQPIFHKSPHLKTILIFSWITTKKIMLWL